MSASRLKDSTPAAPQSLAIVSKVNESLELSDRMKEMKAGDRDRVAGKWPRGERQAGRNAGGRGRVKGTEEERERRSEKRNRGKISPYSTASEPLCC